jgi:hypothetical protein
MLRAQHQVITRAQALECGIPRSTVTSWCAPGGKWLKLLPGVYLTVSAQPTNEQRLMAALLYGGPHSLITGTAALRIQGIQAPDSDIVDVLVPMATKRQSAGFARLHRTGQLPRPRRLGPLRYADPARAVADAARLLPSADDVRVVVAEAVERQACSLPQLVLQLKRPRTRDLALLRTVLADIQTQGSQAAAREVVGATSA